LGYLRSGERRNPALIINKPTPKKSRGGYESMRNLRKFMAILVAIAVMVSVSVTSFAAISEDAQKCATLKILLGEGSGVTESYLAKETTRLQAAILTLRMLDREDAAKAFVALSNFIDADQAGYAEGERIMAYLKAYPELGWQGNPAGVKFDPKGKATVQMIYKVLLTALGYKENVDFTWDGVMAFAASKGLVAFTDGEDVITNDDMATAIVEALGVAVKGDAETTLVEKLVDDEVIALADAQAAGLIVLPLDATVSVTGAKTIKVEFNQAVDPDTAISLKLGYIPQEVTVTMAADNRSATITSETDFAAGVYTVVAGELTKSVTVAAQTLTDFAITTEKLTGEATQVLNYSATNQYGENFAVAPGSFTVTAWNVTVGSQVNIAAGPGNAFTISTDLSGAVTQKVLVTLVHNFTGITKTAEFIVQPAITVNSVAFGTPAPKPNTTRITTNDTSDALVLPTTFTDQYGANVAINATSFGKVTFISSNPAIVDATTISVADVNADGVNELVYRTGNTPGSVTITAIVGATGKTASVTFTVYAPAAFAGITLQQPGGLVVAGEAVTVPHSAIDTFGAAFTLTSFNQGGSIIWFSTNATIVDPAADIALVGGALKITPKAAGTVTVSAFVGGVKQGEITLSVQPAAVATKITTVANTATTVFNKNAGTNTYAVSDFVIVDQYNRAMAAPGGSITMSVVDASTNVITAPGGAVLTAANNLTGTKTVRATWTSGAITLTKDFTVSVIDDGAVVGYTLTPIANTVLKSAIGGYADFAAAGVWARQFVILNGLDASGNKVALSAADKADIILTTNSAAVVLDDTNNAVWAAAGSNAATAVVAAWKKGVKVAEVTFTTSNADSAITTLAFDATAIYSVAKTATIDMAAKLTTRLDQYGQSMDLATINGTWFSNNSSVASVNAAGLVTGNASGQATITYVAPNGVFAQQVVTVP